MLDASALTEVVLELDELGHCRQAVADLAIERADVTGLFERVLELRHNFSSYDAAYLTLAERLGTSVVTCDGKLAAAPNSPVEIEYFPLADEVD